ncbi:DUF397 domain-containing protein [Streptomyces sp. SPB074]|uniref:DUF397 domain-containing protein n=1 Tax=unclassified Streptomyces TaxID=2593676 RepID=UPI00017F102C|nr:DUF397 domain-containing protein [Streptomyces sp. SPB074]
MRHLGSSDANWIKSSYSGTNGGDCVEIALGSPGLVPVRDSKVVDGPVVTVGAASFSAFLEGVVKSR